MHTMITSSSSAHVCLCCARHAATGGGEYRQLRLLAVISSGEAAHPNAGSTAFAQAQNNNGSLYKHKTIMTRFCMLILTLTPFYNWLISNTNPILYLLKTLAQFFLSFFFARGNHNLYNCTNLTQFQLALCKFKTNPM